jgi:hypothetical protein
MIQMTNKLGLVRTQVVLAWATSLVLGGCAGYGPQGLMTGASQSDVREKMGSPTAIHRPTGADSPAHSRLEFARGKHTYMLDFDEQDRLLSWAQVLTEENFFKVQPGWSDVSVRALLGTPANVREVGWRGELVWSYRYESPFCVWFEISLINSSVVSTGNGPDPQCEGQADREMH